MSDQPASDEDSEERLTEIVSYLDGELEDTQMNEVEHRLISDSNLRDEADLLSRTWAMLDELEEVSASKQFTEDTLATVTSQNAAEPDAGPRPGVRRLLRALAQYKVVPCFLLGLVMGTGGLMFSRSQAHKQQNSGDAAISRAALDNFDLLMNVELYSAVPGVEELKQLNLASGNTDSGDAAQ